jgi:hypothetical protein
LLNSNRSRKNSIHLLRQYFLFFQDGPSYWIRLLKLLYLDFLMESSSKVRRYIFVNEEIVRG